MFLLVEVEPNGVVPMHSHTHEQMGICLRGRINFKTRDRAVVIEKGMVYFFQSKEEHGARTLGDKVAVLLEVFSPPREDYLAKIGLSERT